MTRVLTRTCILKIVENHVLAMTRYGRPFVTTVTKSSRKFQENCFSKKPSFFLVGLIKTKLFSRRSLFHTARKIFLSEKIEGALWKNHEKWWNFSNFWTLTKIFFSKKNSTFLETDKNHQNCVPRCYKPIEVCFTLFWQRCWLDFIVLSLIRTLSVKKKVHFWKNEKKVEKTQQQKNVRVFQKTSYLSLSMPRSAM